MTVFAMVTSSILAKKTYSNMREHWNADAIGALNQNVTRQHGRGRRRRALRVGLMASGGLWRMANGADQLRARVRRMVVRGPSGCACCELRIDELCAHQADDPAVTPLMGNRANWHRLL